MSIKKIEQNPKPLDMKGINVHFIFSCWLLKGPISSNFDLL
ncbi:hypothetical protein FORC47_p140 (plasmid) [Bacillus cereus]|nr:hypothetical protein FORC47_p140 [Bacillus cereus]